MKKPKSLTMYTIYYLPSQQTWVQNNLTFLAALPEWNGQNYTVVQELTETQVDTCYEACQANNIAGIKPGSHPQGSPTGCQR